MLRLAFRNGAKGSEREVSGLVMAALVEVADCEEGVALDTRVGHVLRGKWTLKRLMGVGGSGAVYEATHRNGARVAVKIVHPHLSRDQDARGRFLREGHAANAVGHPSVVKILDDDVDTDGCMFLVMEFLEGHSLQATLDMEGGPLPCEIVLEWAERLLAVLVAAHNNRVFHRDLKPSNLFLTLASELKVLDFGLAGGTALPKQEGVTTHAGMILGTPAFMPPEQARGRWSDVDARSDLWAAGATLFTLLSDEHVHPAATSQEQLGIAMTASPRSLRVANPTLPDGVVRFVDRALEFEPARRWQSAREMLTACVALRESLRSGTPSIPVESPRPSPVGDDATTLSTHVSSHKTLLPRKIGKQWSLALLSALALGVALVASLVGAGSAARGRKDAGRQERTVGEPRVSKDVRFDSRKSLHGASTFPAQAVQPSAGEAQTATATSRNLPFADQRSAGAPVQAIRKHADPAPRGLKVPPAPSPPVPEVHDASDILDHDELMDRK
jgi:serine/threonine protein kinase